MTNPKRVSVRLDEVRELKREIAREVEHLPLDQAIREIRKKAAAAAESFKALREAPPRGLP